MFCADRICFLGCQQCWLPILNIQVLTKETLLRIYIRLKQTEDAVEVNAAEAEQGEKQEEYQPTAPEEKVPVPAQRETVEEVQAVQSMDGGEQEAKAVSWHRVNISGPYEHGLFII